MEGDRNSIDFICGNNADSKNAGGVDTAGIGDKKTIHVPQEVLKHARYKEWKEYHLLNREVLRRILSEIEKGKKAGLKAISVKAIINKIRWDLTLETNGRDYKINDAYTGIYTHVIMHNWPEYKLLLTSRQLRSKSIKTKR